MEVWNRSLDLVVTVYRLTRRLPDEERFELSSQLRRSVVSISVNIAEGAGRGTRKECAQFVAIARGSAFEVEALLHVCQRLGYLAPDATREALVDLEVVMKMLTRLRQSLDTPARKPR